MKSGSSADLKGSPENDAHAHSKEGHILEEKYAHMHSVDFSERQEAQVSWTLLHPVSPLNSSRRPDNTPPTPPQNTEEEKKLHAQHEKEDVEELMAELAAKEMRRKAAESMYVGAVGGGLTTANHGWRHGPRPAP